MKYSLLNGRTVAGIASVLCMMFAVSVQSAVAQKLEDILAKHYEARGGLEKLKLIKSMRMTGKVEAGGGAVTLKMEQSVVLPNKILQRIEFGPGMAMVLATNGKDGYMINPRSGSNDPQPSDEPTRKALEEQANFLGDLVDYKEKKTTLEFIGQEDVEGSPTFKIKAVNASGNTTVYYLDADSYLEVKSVRKIKVQDKEQEVETKSSDYKTIQGYTVPMVSVQSAMGVVVKIEKIEFNPTIADSLFDIPKK